MEIIELLKSILYGIVEGVTEFLPISSTGHLLLLEEFLPMNASEAFMEMFDVVVQLGAILAVVVVYFNKLNPFAPRKSQKQKRQTWAIWGKVVIGCIPAAVFGFLFDDWMDEHFYNAYVVAAMLILYGLLFIVLETKNRKRSFSVQTVAQLSYVGAVMIGLFQILAMVPGTSRSGVTILGAMLLGVSRVAAAEFSFFLSIPIMFGASGLKLVKFVLNGNTLADTEIWILAGGVVSAFIVALIAIRFLMSYIKRHDFKAFGYYRIALGLLVLAYFLMQIFVNMPVAPAA
ncbi:MAG: undecaprenyl-diphosphate phosphatase [Lachnospiraceae bacterium]|nr:undecaprenyl-diphosphate phosphatase [Lachnospiraceae bacterium]